MGKYNLQVKGLFDQGVSSVNHNAVLVEPSYVKAMQGVDSETEKMLQLAVNDMVEKCKKTAETNVTSINDRKTAAEGYARGSSILESECEQKIASLQRLNSDALFKQESLDDRVI